MTLKKYLMISALGIAIAGAVLTGCKKESTTVSTDTTAAQDDANAAFVINDTKSIADAAAKGMNAERVEVDCETILHRDTIINSVKDTLFDIYFDTAGQCLDQRTRKGHIFVWYQPGNYSAYGDSVNIGFGNYYVNDIGVSGTATVFNIGEPDTSASGMFNWSFKANLTLTYPSNGGTATWNSSRTNTLTEAGGVWYYAITGTDGGTSRKGATYTINITSPLYITARPSWLGGCSNIESGQLTANVSSFSYPIYVTFGTALGNCNNQATATINGSTFSFSQQ